MAITYSIQSAIRGFNDIILGGVPLLLRQNETAFLSFMCCVAAIDALSGYRYREGENGRFSRFVREYFPPEYAPHAELLYLFRCRILHNFTPAHFRVCHASPYDHLRDNGDGLSLDDGTLFADLKKAAEKFFAEVATDEERQEVMNARLADTDKGGGIYY
jgi:hypothetical protein